MRSRLAATAALVPLAVTGCTPPDHGREAQRLRDDLRALAGVDTVQLGYQEPVTFDAADVDLVVTMREGATPDDVAAVFETAYLGLTDAHHDEEGNLAVDIGDDSLTLRTFESDADVDDVVEAAATGARVAAAHGRTLVQVTTQDVEEDPHVSSTVHVWAPRSATRAERVAVRDAVAAAYGDLPVRVAIRREHR